jgi:hypothetical protein
MNKINTVAQQLLLPGPGMAIPGGVLEGQSSLVRNEGRVPQTPSKDLQAFDPATKHYLMFSGSPS